MPTKILLTLGFGLLLSAGSGCVQKMDSAGFLWPVAPTIATSYGPRTQSDQVWVNCPECYGYHGTNWRRWPEFCQTWAVHSEADCPPEVGEDSPAGSEEDPPADVQEGLPTLPEAPVPEDRQDDLSMDSIERLPGVADVDSRPDVEEETPAATAEYLQPEEEELWVVSSDMDSPIVAPQHHPTASVEAETDSPAYAQDNFSEEMAEHSSPETQELWRLSSENSWPVDSAKDTAAAETDSPAYAQDNFPEEMAGQTSRGAETLWTLSAEENWPVDSAKDSAAAAGDDAIGDTREDPPASPDKLWTLAPWEDGPAEQREVRLVNAHADMPAEADPITSGTPVTRDTQGLQYPRGILAPH